MLRPVLKDNVSRRDQSSLVPLFRWKIHSWLFLVPHIFSSYFWIIGRWNTYATNAQLHIQWSVRNHGHYKELHRKNGVLELGKKGSVKQALITKMFWPKLSSFSQGFHRNKIERTNMVLTLHLNFDQETQQEMYFPTETSLHETKKNGDKGVVSFTK